MVNFVDNGEYSVINLSKYYIYNMVIIMPCISVFYINHSLLLCYKIYEDLHFELKHSK